MKKSSNLSQQRPNRCPCSHVEYIVPSQRFKDIRNFLLKFPEIDTEHNSANFTYPIEYAPPLNTQSDLIRRERDRSKKRQKFLLKKIIPRQSTLRDFAAY